MPIIFNPKWMELAQEDCLKVLAMTAANAAALLTDLIFNIGLIGFFLDSMLQTLEVTNCSACSPSCPTLG